MPSHNKVVIAASATEPCFFRIISPIAAHSGPFVATAPCFNDGRFLGSFSRLYADTAPMIIKIATNNAINNRLREALDLFVEKK
jgi:hypothetical protein